MGKVEDFLSASEIKEAYKEAEGRVNQQLKDKEKSVSAGFSYGHSGAKRSVETRMEDARIGTLGESIGAKAVKAPWTKERQQYFKHINKNPDISPTYKGKEVKVEVRGSRKQAIAFRPFWQGGKDRDFNPKNAKTILVGITDLPSGENVQVGYLTFAEAKKKCKAHPEWLLMKHTPTPVYYIPISEFKTDFNGFGKNENK